LKIAFIQETFNPFRGGSQRRVYEIGRRLAKAGHEVHVFTVRLSPQWKREEVIGGIFVHRIADCFQYLTSDGLRNLFGVSKFLLALSSRSFREFDVLDVNHCPLFPLLLMSLRYRAKVIATFHECWAEDWSKWSRGRIRVRIGLCLEKLSCVLPNRSISVSQFTKRRMVEKFNVEPDKIAVLSNGVDTALFKPPNPEPTRGNNIVFLGRLNPHKRVDLLLQALSKSPSTHLQIIGDGPALGSLMALSHDLGLKDRVTFHRGLSDEGVAEIIAHSQLLVLPSEREGQGIVLLEAMACGTPTIVTNSDMNAAVDLVSDSDSGLVVEHNAQALSEGILRLLNDEELRRKLSEAGERYVKEYSWDAIAERCLKIYENFID